jgi:hypothetical protein
MKIVEPHIHSPTLGREGTRSIPNPGTPFPLSSDWCFTPLPVSGRQALFASKNNCLNVPKYLDILQKSVLGRADKSNPQKNL